MENEVVSQSVASTRAWYLVKTVVAFTLLFAAFAKLSSLWSTFSSARNWELSSVLDFTQIGIEFALSAWLLDGRAVRLCHRVTIGVFLLFSLRTAWLAMRGETSCGCFGKVEVDPWITLALDLGVITGMVRFPPPRQSILPDTRDRWLVQSIGFVIAVAIAIGVGSLANPSRPNANGEAGKKYEVLEPGEWVGKRFPLLAHLTSNADLSSGRWFVVLHRPGCLACETVRKEYAAFGVELVRQNDNRRVAFIEIPWADSVPDGILGDAAGHVAGRLPHDRTWFVETPVVLELESGTVNIVIKNPESGSSLKFKRADR